MNECSESNSCELGNATCTDTFGSYVCSCSRCNVSRGTGNDETSSSPEDGSGEGRIQRRDVNEKSEFYTKTPALSNITCKSDLSIKVKERHTFNVALSSHPVKFCSYSVTTIERICFLSFAKKGVKRHNYLKGFRETKKIRRLAFRGKLERKVFHHQQHIQFFISL